MRHHACRQMLEDATRERDQARAEAKRWHEEYDELFNQERQWANDVKACLQPHITDLQQKVADRDEQVQALQVELAMVREGLAP